MKGEDLDGLLELISTLLLTEGDIRYIFAEKVDFAEQVLRASAPYIFSGIQNIREDIKLLNHSEVSRIDDVHCENGHVSQYASSLLLCRGTTLVSNHLEKRSPLFYGFYHKALRLKQIITHFNFYWSPPGSSGAGNHADVHDVLVVQLMGCKRWHFDEKSIDLSVGDILFVRRGTMHDPISHDSCDSLHLTIGIVSADGTLPSFSEPHSLENEDRKHLALQFIKSMNLYFATNKPTLHFDETVNTYEEDGKIFFHDGINKLGIKKPLFNAIFRSESKGRHLYFTPETNRQHITNFILAFYKAGLPFRIEE